MRTFSRQGGSPLGAIKMGACQALFLVCVLIISACSMKFTGDPAEGFRGIAWGSPPDSIKGLEIIEDHKTMVIAKSQDEKLRMGSADLDEIRYYFLNNALFRVEVRAKGRKNLWHMREEIEKHYGPPASVQDQISHYFWRGENWAIHLNYYNMKNRVTAVYSHVSAAGSQGSGK